MRRRPALLLFLFSCAYLGLVYASPTFGDADAYYHLWMAKRLLAFGPMHAFPWLPFTTLADHFADQHFLYHLALIPFIRPFGDFWGLKIATALFASLAVTAFSAMLRAYGVRRPILWTLPLLFAPGFVFRLLLTKATALALTALFLSLTALKKEKRLALFALAFAYVWLHGGWPILGAVAVVDACVRRSTRFLPAVFGGLALGLVANPFFPQDLYFYWEQIVRMVVVGGHASGVLVGNEWYPTDLGKLIVEDPAVFLPMFGVFALTAFAVLAERPIRPEEVTPARRRDVLFAMALAVVFLLMTLRQVRHKEYFLPLLLFASALLGDAATAVIDVKGVATRARLRLGRLAAPLAAAFFLGLALLAGYEALDSSRTYAGRNVWTRFAGAGAWMRAHLAPDAIVFQTAFDDTPYLLYRDDANRYIAGLDPRFLSDQDSARYWEWRDISEGRRRLGLPELIGTDFGARYVFVKREGEPLRALMKKDPSFERVYQDDEAEVWLVKASLESSQP